MSITHRLIVEPRGGLLLGGTTQPEVHDATARDAAGVPFIPATALNGALREQLTRLLLAVRPETARATLGRILGQEPGPAGTASSAGSSAVGGGPSVERIGGGTTRVYISDGLLQDTALRDLFSRGGGLETRHQVSLSRGSRRAADHHLFARQVVAPFLDGLAFTAEVDVTHLLADTEHGADDLKCLAAAAEAVFAIGGGRSAGLGQVSIRLESVSAARFRGEMPASLPLPDATSLELTLEAREPLCLGDTLFLTNNYHRSLGFVRASTLRGALVTAAMTARGTTEDQSADPVFRRLLLDESTCLRFADGVAVDSEDRRRPRPAPLSLGVCKFEGWAHGGMDRLILGWIKNQLADRGIHRAFDETCRHTPAAGQPCGARLVPVDRWLDAVEPERRVVTRLALDVASGRGVDGKLFSLDLLAPGSRFCARVDRLDAAGRQLLEDAQRGVIRVGHGRGQGYGRVELVGVRPAIEDSIDARLAALDAAVRQAWRRVCSTCQLPAEEPWPGRLLITVTLENDLVLAPGSQATTVLQAFLQALELPAAELLAATLRADQRGGFDTLAGRFKDLEPVVCVGSCLLLAVPDDASHRARCEAIESGGLGGQRAQGYGRVRISDDLHLPGWKADRRTEQ